MKPSLDKHLKIFLAKYKAAMIIDPTPELVTKYLQNHMDFSTFTLAECQSIMKLSEEIGMSSKIRDILFHELLLASDVQIIGESESKQIEFAELNRIKSDSDDDLPAS